VTTTPAVELTPGCEATITLAWREMLPEATERRLRIAKDLGAGSFRSLTDTCGSGILAGPGSCGSGGCLSNPGAPHCVAPTACCRRRNYYSMTVRAFSDFALVETEEDADSDSVADDADLCPGTVLPEGVPTVQLGVNRLADTDGDGVFNTTAPRNRPEPDPSELPNLQDTGGCSCEQIIETMGLGQGHLKFGCSAGAIDDWIAAQR